jgi:putative membrane protein
MINYNPKNWIALIFSFDKSDTFRMLWKELIYIGLLSSFITFLEIHFFPKAEGLKNLIAIYSLLGFVISLLLVFRTNTAYDRWWEGRKIWGGIVNDSRNLASKLNAILGENQVEKKWFAEMISNFSFASKEHLRGNVNTDELKIADEKDKIAIQNAQHKPLWVIKRLRERIAELYNLGIINPEDLYVLDKNLNALIDAIGACERIKNTPIPYSYSLFIKKFIFIYVITLPLAFVNLFGYYSALIATFVFYAMVSMEVLAEEIEDPFGEDDNDLPTGQISTTIRSNVNELLGVQKYD